MLHFALHCEMNSTVHLECLQWSSGLPPPPFDLWTATLAAPLALALLALSWVLPPLLPFLGFSRPFVPLLPPLCGFCRPSCCLPCRPFLGLIVAPLAAPSWVLQPLYRFFCPSCRPFVGLAVAPLPLRGSCRHFVGPAPFFCLPFVGLAASSLIFFVVVFWHYQCHHQWPCKMRTVAGGGAVFLSKVLCSTFRTTVVQTAVVRPPLPY